jgi:hypothetical protein
MMESSSMIDDRVGYKTVYFTCGLFLVSLVNHWVVPWFMGLALFVVFCFTSSLRIREKFLAEGVFLSGLLILLALKFHLYDYFFVGAASRLAFFNNLIVFSVLIFTWVALRVIVASVDYKIIHRSLIIVLCVHVGLFYTQFFTFVLTGHFIDFVQPFTGENSRYLGFDQSVGLLGIFRATGFFIEPSNYSGVVLMLLILIKIRDGFKFDGIFILTLISVFLSFSTAGMMLALALLSVVVVFGRGSRGFKWFVVAAGLIAVFSNLPNLFELVSAQERKYESSSGIREGLLDFALAREGWPLVFGHGPFGVEEELVVDAVDNTGRRVLASLNDSGSLVFLMLNFGLVGAVFYGLLLLATARRGVLVAIVFVIGTLTKISVFYPLWGLFVALLIARNNPVVRRH